MSDKPRRWFQFHLSTAIVLMFVAGGLIWANTIKHESPYSFDGFWNADSPDPNTQWTWGWPFIYAHSVGHTGGASNSFLEFNAEGKDVTVHFDYNWEDAPTIVAKQLVLNFIACGIILLLLAFSVEYRIRRREARKP